MEDSPLQFTENKKEMLKTSQISKTQINIEPKSSSSLSPKRKKQMAKFSLIKTGIEKKTQNILRFQEFKNKEEAEKKINMNILKYLKMKMKISLNRKLTKEEEIVRQSQHIIEKNLDCLEILKKLQEIEKLKQIILNEKQQKLFEFLAKPLVYMNSEDLQKEEELKEELTNSMRINFKLTRQENEKEELKKLLHHFETLKCEGKLTAIDKRLLENLDNDVEEFIEDEE